VVLRSYLEWDEACVERIAGMFAFAIWDGRKRRLFAARDRLGVKPLFYAQLGSRIVFASEIHGLYRFVSPSAEGIDPSALDYYLRFGYVPPDRCVVRGLSKLPPAHTLTFDANGLRISRYWRAHFGVKRDRSIEDALSELDERLRAAVTRRLRSDVPLGSFLSGGIDSGLVTALAALGTTEKLRTFSVGFEGATEDEDERPLARLVADKYGTDHTELLVTTDHRTILASVLHHIGEPFADIGALPMYEISKRAREHITVALSGDGGDESFAGYGNIPAAALAQKMRRLIPAPLRSLMGGAAALPGLDRREDVVGKGTRWIRQYLQRSVERQLDLPNSWHDVLRTGLYGDRAPSGGALTAAEIVQTILDTVDGLEEAEQHLFADLELLLPGDYLTKVDIASNMVSLEVRSPFLDHDLVEFAATLPLSQKLLAGRQKGLLRELAKRYLPREIITAPKRGFAPRVGRWLRDDWSDLVDEFAIRGRLASEGILRDDVLRDVVKEHLSADADHARRIWIVICLDIWWRLFVDGSLRPGDAV
jgi:asparagine synthase (glutamine-hydrolysing)